MSKLKIAVIIGSTRNSRFGPAPAAQKKACMLAYSQLAINAGWNPELPSTELKGLGDLGFDLKLIGFPNLEALLPKTMVTKMDRPARSVR